MRTRLLITLGLMGCGLDTGGDAEGSSSSSTGTETSVSTTEADPTTTPTTTLTTTTVGTESDTTAVTTADTSSESTAGPETGESSESTGAAQWGPFADIVPLEGVNDEFADDDDPTLSADMLEIYFNSNRLGQEDIFVARRDSVGDPFDPPVLSVELSSAFIDTVPELTTDDLTMTLSSNQPAGAGGFDVFISTRKDVDSLWSLPARIDELNTVDGDGALAMTADGLTAFICLNVGAQMDYQLIRTTRRSTDDPWGETSVVDDLLSKGRDCSPWISADGSELWWGSTRPDPLEDENIYRVALDGGEPVGEIEEVTELTTDAVDDDPWISEDGTVIVFTSNRDGNFDIYTATREML